MRVELIVCENPIWNDMSACGSTLRGGTWAASVFSPRAFTLGGGVTCGGGAMLKISASCSSYSICLSPNVVSGLVGGGFRRAWVRSATAYVAASFDDILGNVRVAG